MSMAIKMFSGFRSSLLMINSVNNTQAVGLLSLFADICYFGTRGGNGPMVAVDMALIVVTMA